ncbi:TPA: glycine oxidase ThiO [Candidatus Woesearchaeota archaeon]|nr:glycine oxidase ThiO [Candidatus Woesearchaeota archaeon]HII69121.1 glycine oxidase ThiO [Candidatus Woesearchaeota archaeon]
MSYDAAVIGGGVIGLSCAYRLARNGKKVVVLERGTIREGASWASGGMIRPVTEFEGNRAFFDLCCESARMYPGFVKEVERDSGIAVEYDATGSILVASNKDEEFQLLEKYQFAKSNGIAARILSEGEARRKEPELNMPLRIALYMPSDNQVNNRLLLKALKAAAERNGAAIIEHCHVTSILSSGGRHELVAKQGSFACEHLIHCEGAWAAEHAGAAVKPIRGQMIRFSIKGIAIKHIISHHPIYLIPRKDATLVAGSTVEDVGFDARVTETAMQHLYEQAIALIPALAECTVVERWAGLRPLSATGIPYIGTIREHEHLAAGHYRNGILLAPITAKIIAEAVITGKQHPSFSPMHLEQVMA